MAASLKNSSSLPPLSPLSEFNPSAGELEEHIFEMLEQDAPRERLYRTLEKAGVFKDLLGPVVETLMAEGNGILFDAVRKNLWNQKFDEQQREKEEGQKEGASTSSAKPTYRDAKAGELLRLLRTGKKRDTTVLDNLYDKWRCYLHKVVEESRDHALAMRGILRGSARGVDKLLYNEEHGDKTTRKYLGMTEDVIQDCIQAVDEVLTEWYQLQDPSSEFAPRDVFWSVQRQIAGGAFGELCSFHKEDKEEQVYTEEDCARFRRVWFEEDTTTTSQEEEDSAKKQEVLAELTRKIRSAGVVEERVTAKMAARVLKKMEPGEIVDQTLVRLAIDKQCREIEKGHASIDYVAKVYAKAGGLDEESFKQALSEAGVNVGGSSKENRRTKQQARSKAASNKQPKSENPMYKTYKKKKK